MKVFATLFILPLLLWVLSIWAFGVLATVIGLVVAWAVVICFEWKHIKCCDER